MEKYRGFVFDILENMKTQETEIYETRELAHDAAIKLCAETLGDRGEIYVYRIYTVDEIMNGATYKLVRPDME